MDGLMFSAVTALVTVGGAVFGAHKISSPKKERVVRTALTPTALAKEQHTLAKFLVTEIDRMIASQQKRPSDLIAITSSFATIMKTAWSLDGYYGKSEVTAFLNTLNGASSLEKENITNEFLHVLKDAIQTLVPDCSEAVIRGDKGDHVNDFTYDAMNRVRNKTSSLGQHIRRTLKDAK